MPLPGFDQDSMIGRERMFRDLRSVIAKILNFVLFYFGWAICLAGARAGRPLEGPIVVGLISCLHLFFAANRIGELLLLLSLGAWGCFNDSLYLNLGLIAYYPPFTFFPFLAPPWVIGIWILFATSVNYSMSWMRERWLLAALLGACGGPFSYFTAAKVGAIRFLYPEAVLLPLLAFFWAAILPISLWWGKRLTV